MEFEGPKLGIAKYDESLQHIFLIFNLGHALGTQGNLILQVIKIMSTFVDALKMQQRGSTTWARLHKKGIQRRVPRKLNPIQFVVSEKKPTLRSERLMRKMP